MIERNNQTQDSWWPRYANRMDGMQASEIRELLKIIDQPGVISFAGGIPAFKFFNHDLPEMSQRFNKQSQAFSFFDELPAVDRRNVKLYQVELPSTGTRQYVVCSAKKYLDVFRSIKDQHLRHHYEVIRDGFPCREYFDLEYPTEHNPEVDGAALTEAWVQCVAWKVYNLCWNIMEN